MLGPVFGWELVRTGRRRWHWCARVLYVGLLLALLYAAFDAYENRTQNVSELQSHRVMAQLGAEFYYGFAICQLLAVLTLSPIYAAASISEEKTRQTLPFLLTSQLGDAEIVFSKIALSMLRVVEVLLCGLPLCAICLLLGGVTPEAMLLDFLVAFTACGACCALAVLMAILGRRLVEGLLLVCLLQVIWYLLPVFDELARHTSRNWYVPQLLLDMNAFRAITEGQSTSGTWWQTYAICLTGTTLCWVATSLVAWRVLRPAWRREQEHGGQVPSVLSWLSPARKTQAVWDQPCLWRELRSRRSTSVDRVVWALYLSGAVGVLMSVGANWAESMEVIRTATSTGVEPPSLLIAVYSVFLCLEFLVFPYLTLSGASAFVEEREDNHWELLRATEITQSELVSAKIARLGRSAAGILLLPLLLMSLVVYLGWGTWTGSILAALHCLAASAFWLMLGLALGLRMAKPSQSVVMAMSLLLIFTVVLPTLFVTFATSGPDGYILWWSPFHCIFLAVVDNHVSSDDLPPGMTLVELRWISVFYTAIYAVVAAAMYRWTLVPAGPWREGRDEFTEVDYARAEALRPAPSPQPS